MKISKKTRNIYRAVATTAVLAKFLLSKKTTPWADMDVLIALPLAVAPELVFLSTGLVGTGYAAYVSGRWLLDL